MEMLGLPNLTSLQRQTMRSIIENHWMNTVEIQELEKVFYEMFSDEADREMKKTLGVPEFYQNEDFMIGKSFPVKKEFERTLILVQDKSNDEKEWVGLNISTIAQIPFLEALMSERWNTEKTVVTVSNIRARTLRLLDFVYTSGKDCLNNFIIGFPLATFQLRFLEVQEKFGLP